MKNFYLILTLGMIFMHGLIANCVAQHAIVASNLSAAQSEVVIETKGQFEENKNQWDSRVLYKTDFNGARVFLEKNRFTYVVSNPSDLKNKHEEIASAEPVEYYAFRVNFLGADSKVAVSGEQKQEGYHNYYIGNDPSKWASNVGLYSQVGYKELYPGIDLNVYGREGNMKYDFIIAPGANPEIIRQEYEGVGGISVVNGRLVVKTSLTEITEQQPYSYQWITGKKKQVACNYVLAGNTVHFNFPAGYNKAFPVIIDPVVVVATYSGSTGETWGFCAASDSSGNIYTAGLGRAAGYPVTTGIVYTGAPDIAVSKLNPTGSALIYATYLGNSGTTTPQSLFANNNGQLYVLGMTTATGYPVSAGCYDNSFNGGTQDLVITKLNNSGNIIAATYVGGTGNDGIGNASAFIGEIVVDKNDNPYVVSATNSTNFPMVNSYDNSFNGGTGAGDAVVFKMDSNLSQLRWSTYLGGTNNDAGSGIRVACNGNVYVTGTTLSTNFPVTAGAYQPTYGAVQQEGFVSCLSGNGSVLSASTYFVGLINFIDLDPSDNVYITGTPAFTTAGTAIPVPTTAGVYSNPGSGTFITKLNTALTSVMYSTVFGNGTVSSKFIPTAFMVDNCENVYFSGYGSVGPLSPNALNVSLTNDFYMLKLKKDAASLLYGSYNGGGHAHAMSRFDKKGNLYQAVCDVGSAGFTGTAGAFHPTRLSGSYDIAVFKIDFQTVDSCIACGGTQPLLSAFASSDTTFCNESGECLDFTDRSKGNPTNWSWSFPGAQPDTSTMQNPIGICYYIPGTYPVSLTVTNAAGTDSIKLSGFIVFATGAAAPTLTHKGDTLFCSHEANYQWYYNGSPITNATDSFYVATQNGDYNVYITDDIGCSRLGNGIVILDVSVGDIAGGEELSIYPNPVKNRFTVYGLPFRVKTTIEIFNVLGECLYRSQLPTSNYKQQTNIDISSFAKGVYVVELISENKIFRAKVMKE